MTGPTQRRVRREDEVNGIKISALLRGHTEQMSVDKSAVIGQSEV